ncbi:hypothetical protein TNCV_1943001 [Trichonephila clavipes]|nr:hypothetical protein TNCV_1943001 [Trichonephila clavipes]
MVKGHGRHLSLHLLLLTTTPHHEVSALDRFNVHHEARSSALVSSLATFLRLPQFPLVAFSFVIGLNSSKNDAADFENSVVAIYEP